MKYHSNSFVTGSSGKSLGGELKRLITERLGHGRTRWEKHAEEIEGGMADDEPDDDFPTDELAKGKKVEKEHTNSKEKAKEIAKDHLKEDKKYYTKLHEMEKKAHDSVQKIAKAMASSGEPLLDADPHYIRWKSSPKHLRIQQDETQYKNRRLAQIVRQRSARREKAMATAAAKRKSVLSSQPNK